MKKKENDLSETPEVSIIILNYNAGDLLFDCIESILNSNYSNYEIILVDNASKDRSHIQCKQKFPTINLISNSENLGYCEGNNVGIRLAKGKFIIVLNPDTIVDPNWISELLNSYEKFGDGLYQPKFLTTTDHSILMSTGNMIQLFGFGFSRGKGEPDNSNFENNEIIGYASGTCLFSSSKIFQKLNMFDPFLFAYHDDLDLGWRAALIGIPSYYVPKSIVYHPPEGFSFKWSPFKFYLLEKNRMYCLLTHYSKKTLFKLFPSLVFVEIAILFFYLKKGMLKFKLKAIWDILKNWKHIQAKYHEIQNFRIINDDELIKNFSDNLDIPKAISDSFSNNLFSKFIFNLSKFSRKFI